jgi:hypothetical protein
MPHDTGTKWPGSTQQIQIGATDANIYGRNQNLTGAWALRRNALDPYLTWSLYN